MKSEILVLSSHHPDCAALWPQKPCDCGLAEQRGRKPLPLPKLGPIPVEKVEHTLAKPKRPVSSTLTRSCAKCSASFTQPKPKSWKDGAHRVCPKCRGALWTRTCTRCHRDFKQPMRPGKPRTICEECR